MTRKYTIPKAPRPRKDGKRGPDEIFKLLSCDLDLRTLAGHIRDFCTDDSKGNISIPVLNFVRQLEGYGEVVRQVRIGVEMCNTSNMKTVPSEAVIRQAESNVSTLNKRVQRLVEKCQDAMPKPCLGENGVMELKACKKFKKALLHDEVELNELMTRLYNYIQEYNDHVRPAISRYQQEKTQLEKAQRERQKREAERRAEKERLAREEEDLRMEIKRRKEAGERARKRHEETESWSRQTTSRPPPTGSQPGRHPAGSQAPLTEGGRTAYKGRVPIPEPSAEIRRDRLFRFRGDDYTAMDLGDHLLILVQGIEGRYSPYYEPNINHKDRKVIRAFWDELDSMNETLVECKKSIGRFEKESRTWLALKGCINTGERINDRVQNLIERSERALDGVSAVMTKEERSKNFMNVLVSPGNTQCQSLTKELELWQDETNNKCGRHLKWRD